MTDAIGGSDVLALAPHYRLSWEDAQSAYVLLYPEGIVRLNGTAAEIIKQCVSSPTFDDLLARLQALYPDAPIEVDVRAFLEEAVSRGWITRERD